MDHQHEGRVQDAFRNEKDISASSTNFPMEELLEIEKNPMLLTPVIRCIFEFVDLEDIKNCRLVSREWGSAGKVALASRGIVNLTTRSPDRRPENFHSCFLKSVNLFSKFHISGVLRSAFDDGFRTIEELNKFFDGQQKYIKELTLMFTFSDKFATNIDIISWISKSPMVQKDAKLMTKLSILISDSKMFDIPWHLIAHIRDLKLLRCKVTLEAGIKICPVNLSLENTEFYQDGIKLDHIRINDIVDLSKAKEVSLDNWDETEERCTKYIVDLRGNTVLKKLNLRNAEILSGETSQWIIEKLAAFGIPYLLNSEMKIKELWWSITNGIDLFTLPNSIQKLTLKAVNCTSNSTIRCSQPILLENLTHLHVIDFGRHETDYSYLSHFMNCPQLTHLRLDGSVEKEVKSIWMPKNVKTLTLEASLINCREDSDLNLEKLIIKSWRAIDKAFKLCEARIQVEDFVVECVDLKVERESELVDFLEYRNRYSFGNRLYIGKLWWGEKELEDSVLNGYVDIKSSFYVFENGENGSAISEKAFRELIPQHIL